MKSKRLQGWRDCLGTVWNKAGFRCSPSRAVRQLGDFLRGRKRRELHMASWVPRLSGAGGATRCKAEVWEVYMNAYDYQGQQWIEGEPAIQLLIAQLRDAVELSSADGEGYGRMINGDRAELLRRRRPELEELLKKPGTS